MPRPVKLWLPVLLWMALIFIASTDLGSSGHTSRIIGPFLHWLNPSISPGAIELTQTLIRKCGHFLEYAVLALLVLRAVNQSQRAPSTGYPRAAAIALFIASGYAVTDEFHQSLIPTRSASIYDVLIDTSGAMTALAIASMRRKLNLKSTADRAAST